MMTIREIVEDWFKVGTKLARYASEKEIEEMVKSRDEAIKELDRLEKLDKSIEIIK